MTDKTENSSNEITGDGRVFPFGALPPLPDSAYAPGAVPLVRLDAQPVRQQMMNVPVGYCDRCGFLLGADGDCAPAGDCPGPSDFQASRGTTQ